MRRFRRLLSDAWSLAMPYWRSEERWQAMALLAAIIALNLVLVGVAVLLTYWQRAFFNALEAKDWDGFIALLLWWRVTPADGFVPSFTLIGVIFVPATAFALYLRQALQYRWRRWMTDTYLESWLADRAYYRIALTDSGTDNPDQRIAEDARLFVDNTLILGLGILRAVVTLLSFVVVLWSLSDPLTLFGMTIPGYLVWAALLYAICGTLLTHFIGRRLIALNFAQQKVEADFRFSLIRFYENAENIAFYRGEPDEKRELTRRFSAIVGNWRSIMAVTKDLTLFTTGFGQIALVFPFAVVAPAYFAGRMALGGIFQIANAFLQVQLALSWAVDNYPALTAWLATVERLAGFTRSVAAARASKEGPQVSEQGGDALALSRVVVALPDGSRLLNDIDLKVAKGQRVLLAGSSGAGKSTLFRAIAGIWPFGSGAIEHPAGRLLFMPQKPYLPLGTLKLAVCYPASEADFSDDDVAVALQEAGLGHLASRLRQVDTWERRLSGGEMQRLALARALLLRPDWLFLDEATANLDPDAEQQFYRSLRERLPGATLISIAHRQSVAQFHDRFLRIENGALRLEA